MDPIQSTQVTDYSAENGILLLFSRYRLWITFIFTTILITTTAWYVDHQNNLSYYQQVRSEVQSELSDIRSHLESKLNSNIQIVYGLIAVISVEPNMTQERFAQLAKPLLQRENQLRNIGGAPDMIIRLMYPLKGNESAIGLNYLKNDKQRSGAEMARDTGQLVLAGPINLVQGGQGFIGRIPVYSEYIKQGERTFWGLVSAVIDTHQLYKVSGLLDPDLNIDIAIFGQDKRFSSGSIFFGNNEIFTKEPVVGFIELPFGSWQLAAIPKNGWPSVAKNHIKFRFYLFVLSLFILIPVMLFTWLSNRHREQQNKLNALYRLSPLGIALTDFKTGKFHMVNPMFCKETGFTEEELGQKTHWDFIPKQDHHQFSKNLVKLKHQKQLGPVEQNLINRYNQKHPVSINALLIENASGEEFIWSYVEDRTVQKMAEENLKQNNEQLELVIKATQVGIWDWQVQTGDLKLNERWAEIIGYTLEELGDISIETWLNHAHPEDLEESGVLLEQHWQHKSEAYIYEARMKHKNGHYVWVLDTGKVIEWQEDGKPKRMVGTHFDITDKKLVEQEIAQTNASLAKQMKLIKTIVKTQGEFISHSEAEHDFTSLLKDIMHLTDSNHAFIGRINHDHGPMEFTLDKYVYHNASVSEKRYIDSINYQNYTISKVDNLIIQSAKLGEIITLNDSKKIHNSQIFKADHPKIYNLVIIPVINNFKTVAIIGLANRVPDYDQDIIHWLTPLINTIGQIIESLKNIEEKQITEKLLIDAKNEAEAAGNAKTEFLATMSHEIRTPMNGVLGMLNLLQKSDLNKEQLRKVDMAKTSADNLLSIINDILDFTKIDSGKLKLEHIEFNIRELIDDVSQSLALKSQEKGIEIILDLADLKHSHVISDPVRIRQVLINLIGNAIKFTQKGNIVIQANTQIKDHNLIFQCNIIDTGIGVEKDKIHTLFDSFTQADTSTTRKFGGTGLGLSISKRICHLMNGNIWATSKLGKGSTFSFEIPVDQHNISTPISLPDNFEDLKILIADKSIRTCEAVNRQLLAWHNHPTYTCDLASTVENLKNNTSYDFIFIDQSLFDENLFSFRDAMMDYIKANTTKFILMTNIHQKESDIDINNLGFIYHFAKPITTKDLIDSFSLVSSGPETQQKAIESTRKELPKNSKLLLVEDILFNQEVASMLLLDMGIKCQIANNGQEAVDITKEMILDKKPYDAILMDCQMPIKDGYDATREIKAFCKEQEVDIPIIAMTANAMSGDAEKCFSAGMDDYLSKPIDEDKLFSILVKWLCKEGAD